MPSLTGYRVMLFLRRNKFCILFSPLTSYLHGDCLFGLVAHGRFLLPFPSEDVLQAIYCQLIAKTTLESILDSEKGGGIRNATDSWNEPGPWIDLDLCDFDGFLHSRSAVEIVPSRAWGFVSLNYEEPSFLTSTSFQIIGLAN